MPSQSEVKEIDAGGKVSSVRRFDRRDFNHIAEYVQQEHSDREKARKNRERHWEDIDRQVAMIPDIAFKKLPNGEIDKNKMWMSEVEPPLQAQTLEVCTADARRFMFPENGPWFRAHAEMTDEYLERANPVILGDRAEVPSLIDQDNVDKICESFVTSGLRQYDFRTRADRVNAEAIKYGMGVARMRMQTKAVYIHETSGTRKEVHKIPVFTPCSVKNLFLDDPMPSMHSTMEMSPGVIAKDYIRHEKLLMAANRGSNDPDDEDGGWMPENLKGIEPDKDGYVTVLEYEGDMVIPRKTVRSMVMPGVIVSVVQGGKNKTGKQTSGVIRLRWRKKPYSSYLFFPYHYEGVDEIYPTSPLEKGRPLQIMAADAMNRILDSAALKNGPPIGYDRTDTEFAQNGGPRIHPYAKWGTNDPVTVHANVGGDPSALAEMLRLSISLYAELTGVLPARIGAQTVSHTTAFAKEQEISRGAVRTIDYVNTSGSGAITRMLHMAYDMGRDAMGRDSQSIFMDAYGGYVSINKKDLPDMATFEWFGSGGPAEEQAKMQRKLQSLQLAIQMDNLAGQQQQTGITGTVDLEAAIKSTLRDGGWTDVDTITRPPQTAQPAQPGTGNPGAQAVALQQLGLAAGQ